MPQYWIRPLTALAHIAPACSPALLPPPRAAPTGTPWLRARFQVTAYFAPQFAELRRRCVQGGEAAFIASLGRCRRWASRGGKSNAYFAKTRDDRWGLGGAGG